MLSILDSQEKPERFYRQLAKLGIKELRAIVRYMLSNL